MIFRRRSLSLALGLLGLVPATAAEETVLALMERVAGWQLAHPARWKPPAGPL